MPRIVRRKNLKKKKLMFILLPLVLSVMLTASAVTPVHADTKVFEMKIVRMPIPSELIVIDGITYEMSGYANGRMVSWMQEDGDTRSLLQLITKVELYYRGE